METMSEDAKAILLLCGHLGGASESEPLGQQDYNEVVHWLMKRDLRPADLLLPEHVAVLARETSLAEGRLTALLKRGVKLGFAVEKWARSGLWVVSRSDSDYPARYKTHLKEKAPPLLFGAGERSLMAGGGLAIVGSRNVDAEGEAFAQDVAAWCARGGVPVVSGGARGVDQIAMRSALDAGGTVVGVLADSLLRRSVSRESRRALADGRLLLISPYHPEAGFSVGNAMGRNKLIYGLAEYGLVVSAESGKGGTWQGAEEELKRTAGRPVFVRLNGSVPAGNRKLVELGAVAFPSIAGCEDPATLLREAAAATPKPHKERELPLFPEPAGAGPSSATVRETRPTRESPPVSPPAVGPVLGSVYEAVLPVILAELDQSASVVELATRLDVSKAQVSAWLKRAVNEDKVRKLTRPVRYMRKEP